MPEKKPESITIKVSNRSHCFVKIRSEQLGMESPGEYIRHLISLDEEKAESDLNLLAESLGLKVISENEGNQ